MKDGVSASLGLSVSHSSDAASPTRGVGPEGAAAAGGLWHTFITKSGRRE